MKKKKKKKKKGKPYQLHGTYIILKLSQFSIQIIQLKEDMKKISKAGYLSGRTPNFSHTWKNSRCDELAAAISPTRT
jgi:hypothetical protein